MKDDFLQNKNVMMLIPLMISALDELNDILESAEGSNVEAAGLVIRDTVSQDHRYLPIYGGEKSYSEVASSLHKTAEAVNYVYNGFLEHAEKGEIH